MRRLAAGFSLVENVFSALIIAIAILGMSTVISTYTVSQQKTKDRPFALNLAQQLLDEVLVNLVTQNSMICCDNPKLGRGRSYFLRAENLTVSQYFFNNFPLNVTHDPVGPPKREMATIPWEIDVAAVDRQEKIAVPDAQKNMYTGAVGPDSKPFIQYTRFFRNRFYRVGGDLVSGDDEESFKKYPDGDPSKLPTLEAVCEQMRDKDTPPRYAVRFQLFGIPAVSATDKTLKIGGVDAKLSVGDIVLSADNLKSDDYDYPANPLTPPKLAPLLIGDSCIPSSKIKEDKGTGTGRMYILERPTPGKDSPEYFPHFTSKVLVTRVYRTDDLLENDSEGKRKCFPEGSRFDHEIASASIVLVGRVMGK